MFECFICAGKPNRVLLGVLSYGFECVKSVQNASENKHDRHPLNILFELNDVYLVWIRQISEWTADWTNEGCLFSNLVIHTKEEKKIL